jgi:hypothetical protein
LLPEKIKIKTYKTINLPSVLCICETGFLALREAHRLRLFENRALRRIFEPKRGKITGCWIKLHNEELHNLCSLPGRIIKSKKMRCTGNVARMGEQCVEGFERKTWWKETIRKLRRRWEDKIKWFLQKYDGGMDRIYLAQDRDK